MSGGIILLILLSIGSVCCMIKERREKSFLCLKM